MAYAHRSLPIRRASPVRESTRITLARVLALGVRVSWREAAAIVHEAIARTGPSAGPGPARVTPESCVVTRGGDVVLTGTAAQARPEVVVTLLDDLLASCDEPGRFAGAVADGTALDMVEGLSQHTSPKRRQVEVAAVALRGLVAEADAARARADADDRGPSADGGNIAPPPPPAAVPTPVAAATPTRRPWPPAPAPVSAGTSGAAIAEVRRPGPGREDPIAVVEGAPGWATPVEAAPPALATPPPPAQRARPRAAPRPPSFSTTVPDTRPRVGAVRMGEDLEGGARSRTDWVKRGTLAALVCLVVAVAAGGILMLRMPTSRQSTNEPVLGGESAAPVKPPSEPVTERSELAIEPPALEAPVGFIAPAPVAGPEPDPLPGMANPPAERPEVARSAPSGSPTTEGRSAPSNTPPESFVRPVPPPEVPAAIEASRPRPSPPAPATVTAPAPAIAASVPAPVAPPSAVAGPGPGTTASAPVEPPVSAPSNVPATAVAGPPAREAETRAIENVLGRYRSAFNTLDAGAAVAVWPTVNEKTLTRAFETLESHTVSFERCEIEIFTVLAEAECRGSARYVPKVGNRTPKDEARRWLFSLRKTGGGWLIDRVDAR
jgi:hypothetical protein